MTIKELVARWLEIKDVWITYHDEVRELNNVERNKIYNQYGPKFNELSGIEEQFETLLKVDNIYCINETDYLVPRWNEDGNVYFDVCREYKE